MPYSPPGVTTPAIPPNAAGAVVAPPAAAAAGGPIHRRPRTRCRRQPRRAVVQPPPANWIRTPRRAPRLSAAAARPVLAARPPALTMATMQKFLQHVDLDYHWFAGHNGRQTPTQELGINDVELSGTFAFPMFYNSQTPLLITPGFAVHYWAGPVSVPVPPPHRPADLPPRTYDAYLDAAWNPQINEWFGAELDVRIGVYSDFARVTTTSSALHGQGRGGADVLAEREDQGGRVVSRPQRGQDAAGRRHLLDAQPRRLLQHPLPQPEDRPSG